MAATTQSAAKAESSTAAAPATIQPPAEMNGAAPKGDGVKKQNLLHLSSQRSRRFYERAARELFASGCEEVQLSALKSAVPGAIAVALSLEDKNAAKIVKVNTQQLTPNASKNRNPFYNSSGVTITLHRHPEFKGTRIVPSHIFFCPPLTNSSAFAYPETAENVYGLFASVVIGEAGRWFSSKYGEALKAVLNKVGQGEEEMSKNLHDYIFGQATEVNKGVQNFKAIKFIGELSTVKSYNPNLKAAFVRMAPQKDADKVDMTGTTFIEVFEEHNCPHDNPINGALVYLVAPRESSYKSTQEFLDAVELAAGNLMAALCDFNGYCRRGNTHAAKLKRIAIARLGLFSHEPNVTTTPKIKIAETILKGLNNAYHFGIAPKLQFSNLEGEDAIKSVWLEQTGAEQVRVTENDFGRRNATEQN